MQKNMPPMDASSDAETQAADGARQITEAQRKAAMDIVNRAPASSWFYYGVVGAILTGIYLWLDWRFAKPGALVFVGGLFAISLVIFAVSGLSYARMLREVNAGRYQQGTARVDWQGVRYGATVSGHVLDLSTFSVKPGTYRFSYLPYTGYVAAVDALTVDPEPVVRAILANALAWSIGFTQADLSAYRQGKLLKQGRLVDSQVTSADGVVRRIKESQDSRSAGRNSRTTYYYYQLGQHTWSVGLGAYNALMEGETYRAYFLPDGDRLLAIEPIDAAT